jgi:hypothetical protein
MPALTLNLTLSDDRMSVTIEALDPGGAKVSGTADAADLDELIVALGSVRAALADVVPEELEPPARVATIRDPAWLCESQDGRRIACFRHPGYGWLAFALSEMDAEQVAEALLEPPGYD